MPLDEVLIPPFALPDKRVPLPVLLAPISLLDITGGLGGRFKIVDKLGIPAGAWKRLPFNFDEVEDRGMVSEPRNRLL